MALKIFSFVEEVKNNLDKRKSKLELIAREIREYFEDILLERNEGYLNISSRVKTSSSLEEKIFRNNYYKKYASPKELFDNLSDLIGVRIECRFIQDEKEIYKVLKGFFNKIDDNGLYFNEENDNITLKLEEKQPQKQKNGFKIFRIDGVYKDEDININFELQIKSLVNIFWGEIEHKVIYKNNNYMLVNKFFKEILDSIKQNLSMIDNQMLIIYKQFNRLNGNDSSIRKEQLEAVLSKSIYDIFSTRMKKDIGFIIDFKESCDSIVRYIFRSNNAENVDEYSKTLLSTLNTLSCIDRSQVKFDEEIYLERSVKFDDEFSSIIGNKILKVINIDFQWNLFFRILFEIGQGNNADNFETFISFIKNRLYENGNFKKFYYMFEEKHAKHIIDTLMREAAYTFIKVDSIELIYEDNIQKIIKHMNYTYKFISENIASYEQWITEESTYIKMFRFMILSIFDYHIDERDLKDFMHEVNLCSINKNAKEEIEKYVRKNYNLDS